MTKSVLLDLTQCIGCGACTVACKLWNQLEFADGAPATGEKAVKDHSNWTTVTFRKVQKDGAPVWRFVKEQCLHCLEPACVSVCFAKALQISKEGAVVYRPDLCVGCRYCMLGCPFSIPKYEWQRSLPNVSKCQMCAGKIVQGEVPACVGACPTSAMTFGERDDNLALARQRIEQGNGRYINHIYGEKEAGGTRWLYLSDVDFSKLGMVTNVPEVPIASFTDDYLRWTVPLLAGGALLFTALRHYTKRRNDIESSQASQKESKKK